MQVGIDLRLRLRDRCCAEMMAIAVALVFPAYG